MEISKSKTKRKRIVAMKHHADDHLMMTTAEEEILQVVAAMMMEEEVTAEEEVRSATTPTKNGRNTVTERDSGNDDRVHLVPLQGGDVVRSMDASLLDGVKETLACQRIGTLLIANLDNGSKSTSTTDHPVSKCSCVGLKTSLIITPGTRVTNLLISKLLCLFQQNI